jgi:putative ABC transport system permease protein
MIDRSTLRIALRTLGRHRGFTTVAVLSIAVAVALNTTMYSALDKLIDPAINARNPERVYQFRFFAGPMGRQLHPSVIQDALRDGIPGLEGASGMDNSRFYGAGAGVMNPGLLAEAGGRYTRAEAVDVQPNFFEFLGTHPITGRVFSASDEGTGAVVISDRLSIKLFAGESPIGQTLMLHGEAYGVIGVVRRTQIFAPLSYDLWALRRTGMRPVPVSMLRFHQELEPYGLLAQLNVVARRLEMSVGDPPGTTAFNGGAFATAKRRLTIFDMSIIGAVLAVLLVACANLANLQLARGLARNRELALRSAVGASRRHLVQLLVLETGIVAVIGLVLGVVLTLWGIHVVRATIPPAMDAYSIEPQASWRMFVFAAAAAVVCLFLIGLLPALRVSRVDPSEMLKSGAGTGANRHHRRRYGMLVSAQIGFALPVLIASVVLLKSAWRYGSRDYLVSEMFGYDPTPLVVSTVQFRVPERGSVRLADVSSELISIARRVPGVVEAAVQTTDRPERNRVTVDDENGVLRDEAAYGWSARLVSPSYLRVFGRSIDRGRDFADTEFDGQSVIVDKRTAKFLWGNSRDPIGRVIKFGFARSERPWHQVVGVAGDARDTNAIRRWDPDANFRLNEVLRVITPADTFDRATNLRRNARSARVSLIVRVQGNTDLAAVRLQRALRSRTGEVEPAVVPMLTETGIEFWRTRAEFAGSLFSAFALVGLGLVAVGVYGIVAHSIAERRRELAVRISLGATARDVLHSVLREGNVLILAGIAIGLLFAKFGVPFVSFAEWNYVTDSLLYATIAGGLFALAALAAIIPAIRATRIDPVEALRHE